MAKQIAPKTTTVELNITRNGTRASLKVLFANSEALKIVYGSSHTITAGNRQISDSMLCKILKYVGTYASNSETDSQRFKRLATFFEGFSSIDSVLASI